MVKEVPYIFRIKADGGAVSIWGRIKSAKDVERIKKIVSRVPGVKQVKSKIRNWSRGEGWRLASAYVRVAVFWILSAILLHGDLIISASRAPSFFYLMSFPSIHFSDQVQICFLIEQWGD